MIKMRLKLFVLLLAIPCFLVAQSVYVGMESAVKRMIQIIEMAPS